MIDLGKSLSKIDTDDVRLVDPWTQTYPQQSHAEIDR